MSKQTETTVHYRTCPLCEATCGLEIHVTGGKVTHIQGDKLDPLSEGHICPKGYSLKELHNDPDRIHKPMVRTGSEWREVSWEEAFAEVKRGLRKVQSTYGKDAVATYYGNPLVHNLSGMMYSSVLLRALGTKYKFSASSLDQMPQQLASELMFGSDLAIPVPDIDRTEYFVILGGNPLVSNGSLWTAPNMRQRLKRLQQRGGRLVVIDPVRTATAKAADAYYSIRPGTDGLFLFAIVHTLFAENLVRLGKLAPYVNGGGLVQDLAQDFAPETVAERCGMAPETIRAIARDLSSKRAALYGRMGTCTQPFGSVNSWLIDVINVLTGNLDSEGGMMFTAPAAGARLGKGRSKAEREGVRFGRYASGVRGLPEVLGEFPSACMAEEMEAGHIRAFITIAGNPALSAPNSTQLQRAMEGLDFMVSVDCYLNETTRHAHVLLPVPSPLERSHYDIIFYHFAVRNVANYSEPVFPLPADQLDEWEVLLQLTAAVTDQELGENPVKALDDFTVMTLLKMEIAKPDSPLAGRDPLPLFMELGKRRGPDRLLDFLLRTGDYGDWFGTKEGLSLDMLQQNPHGVDLGALQSRIPEVLTTPSGRIELAPELFVRDVPRLLAELGQDIPEFTLIGRRELQSNNSWMHNLPSLLKGRNRCTLWLHPEDAARLGITDGEEVTVVSETGRVTAPAEITEAILAGVVSLPHGWGHDAPGTRLRTAGEKPGVNANILTNNAVVDAVSGNAVFNGVPVTIQRG